MVVPLQGAVPGAAAGRCSLRSLLGGCAGAAASCYCRVLLQGVAVVCCCGVCGLERACCCQKREDQNRKSQKKEDADAGKGRRVAIHCVFPMI